MMEHAMFFVMLMPGAELDGPRRQAEEFQRLFAHQLEQSQGIRADNYVAFNRSTIDLARRFSDYKKSMREQQAAGKIHSLVWPLFFQHTAREADRFATRLDLYNRRTVELDRSAVVEVQPRCEAVGLAGGVLEEQRPHQAVNLSGCLLLAHRLLVVAESPGQIDRAAIERDVVVGANALRLLQLMRKEPLELFGLAAWPIQFRARHQHHEEHRVLHHDFSLQRLPRRSAATQHCLVLRHAPSTSPAAA